MRRDRLVSQLTRYYGQVSLTGTLSGTHIAWHLPDHFPPALEIQGAARRRSVGVYTVEAAGGHEFGSNGLGRKALMMGFGSLTERQIDEGVARLTAALDDLGVPKVAPRKAAA
jgi:GntR family transcriptional regulator/MocR family aminotransferase